MFIPIGTEERERRGTFPVVTLTLVTLNVVVFLFELFLLLTGGEQVLGAFIGTFGTVPAAVTAGQSYYTLFTAMFVHGGLMHLLGNMLYLLAFGDNIEDRLGRWAYLALYVLSGLLADFAQIASDPASTVPGVGASGAIAGVLGAYLILFPKGRVRVLFLYGPLTHISRISAALYIGFWFILQFFSGVASLGVQTAETGGTAYFAHIGGLVAGLALALVYRALRHQAAPNAARQV